MAAVKKSVSVKDVARLAGVSEQTVSRTVHDSPSVRPETKERVRAAMRELGYRPNFAGRSLRRGKFKTVGVAMFNITGTGNLDRMEGFAAAADKHGYASTLTKVDGHPYTLESASSRMSALPVDGMVVIMNHGLLRGAAIVATRSRGTILPSNSAVQKVRMSPTVV